MAQVGVRGSRESRARSRSAASRWPGVLEHVPRACALALQASAHGTRRAPSTSACSGGRRPGARLDDRGCVVQSARHVPCALGLRRARVRPPSAAGSLHSSTRSPRRPPAGRRMHGRSGDHVRVLQTTVRAQRRSRIQKTVNYSSEAGGTSVPRARSRRSCPRRSASRHRLPSRLRQLGSRDRLGRFERRREGARARTSRAARSVWRRFAEGRSYPRGHSDRGERARRPDPLDRPAHWCSRLTAPHLDRASRRPEVRNDARR